MVFGTKFLCLPSSTADQVDRKDFIGRDALAANPTPVLASAGSPLSKAKRQLSRLVGLTFTCKGIPHNVSFGKSS